jgi:hypothetical protein
MRNIPKILFVIIVVVFTSVDVLAQCPMCKTALGSARDNGSDIGTTLNSGILYLLVLPYAIASIFGIIYYNKWRKKRMEQNG